MSISCLVPTYNEGKRIFTVLDCLTKVKDLDEIIVIDDASEINLTSEIKEKYPNINVLRFEKNHGKAGAIFEGLKIARGENILLFDADLFDIDLSQLQEAVSFFKNQKEYDMVILRREKDPLFHKIIRTDLVTSGQRLLKKEDLKKILNQKLMGFQLELAINDYMIKNKKRVGWLPLICQDLRKAQKFGFIKGNLKEVLMTLELFSFKGPLYFFKNLFFFCRERIKIPPSFKN